jgi:hypothetical protein
VVCVAHEIFQCTQRAAEKPTYKLATEQGQQLGSEGVSGLAREVTSGPPALMVAMVLLPVLLIWLVFGPSAWLLLRLKLYSVGHACHQAQRILHQSRGLVYVAL